MRNILVLGLYHILVWMLKLWHAAQCQAAKYGFKFAGLEGANLTLNVPAHGEPMGSLHADKLKDDQASGTGH